MIVKGILLASASLPVIILASPVSAQVANDRTAPAPDSDATGEAGGLDEIVVTAQKRTERLQDVPITVNAVGAETLAQTNINTQVALAQVTPNISVNAFSTYVSPFIRGIGSKIVNVGLDPSSSVYFDDQYIARAASGLLSFTDIDRVEVLKGPQGTLYGRNAVGGAIKIILNDPKPEPETRASIGYGSYDRVFADVTLNVPLTPTLALRITGNYDKADGYVKSLVPGAPKGMSRNQKLVLGKLLWTPTDQLRVRLRADYAEKHDTDGQTYVPLDRSAPGNVGVALGGIAPTGCFYCHSQGLISNNNYKGSLKVREGELRIDYSFDPVTISSITTYRHGKNFGNGDLDGTTTPVLDGSSSVDFSKVFTQEFQAVSTTSGPFSYTAGLYYFHEKGAYGFCVGGTSVFGPGFALCGEQGTRTRSIAPYGEATYAFTDDLKLTLGARYTVEKKYLDYNVIYTGPYAYGAGSVVPMPRSPSTTIEPPDTTKFKRFTPKATLSYKVTPHVLAYATLSTGFKSGGLNIPTIGLPVDRVDPEKLTGYELGAKFSSRNVRFNVAGFYYKQKDLQVSTINPVTNSTRVENAGAATIYGIEADMDWAATDRLTLGGSAGWLHGRFDRYIGTTYELSANLPACAAAGGLGASSPPPLACLGYTALTADFEGRKIPNAPEFTANLRANYSIPLAELGELNLNANAAYSAKVYQTADESIFNKAIVLVSANATWTSESERWTVSVFGTNLAGEKYYTNINPSTTGGYQTIGRPREFGARVGVRF